MPHACWRCCASGGRWRDDGGGGVGPQVRKCQNAVAFRKVLVANKEGVEEERLMPCSPGEEGCIEMTIMELASSEKFGVAKGRPGMPRARRRRPAASASRVPAPAIGTLSGPGPAPKRQWEARPAPKRGGQALPCRNQTCLVLAVCERVMRDAAGCACTRGSVTAGALKL